MPTARSLRTSGSGRASGSGQAALLWLCVVCAGCGPGETLLVPVARLVDAPNRVDGRARAPGPKPERAAIERDQRPVLRAYPARRIHSGALSDRSGRPGTLRLAVAPPLADAQRLVLTPFVKARGAAGYYRPLPSQLASVRGGPGTARSTVDLDASLEPGALDLFVEARRPPSPAVQRIETAALEIPAGARLDFAIGILEPAWRQEAVRFRVLACDEDAQCDDLFAEELDPRGPGGGAWRDRRLSLEGLAGERRTLHFETRFDGSGDSAFSFPVWGDPTLLAPRPRSSGDSSLILVSIDTLRADHLDAYGYPRATAPFVSGRLAAEGTLFEAAVSAATTTAPSHMTMFTSLQPSVHSVRGNALAVELPARAPTLAQRLRGHGFATAAFTEGGGIAPRRGFERGFGRYLENRTRIPHELETQSAVTFPEALEWVRRVGDERFFLFLHTYEVHGPYRPPERYGKLFAEDPPGPDARRGLPAKQQPVLYDREIRYADEELRRFVEGLASAGRLDDTLLVVTSDHGEEFLDHGNLGHGATPYEEVLRVPLVLRGPGVPAGRRVAAPVGLVDLAPTLLDLLGLPALDAARGRSFAELVRGGSAEGSWSQRPLFSEAWFRWAQTPSGRRRVEQPTLAVRVGERKLIRFREGSGFRYEYYDLGRDPRERRNLYPERAADADDLRALLDGYERDAAARRSALVGDDGPDGGGIDPDQEQGLRALGYLE